MAPPAFLECPRWLRRVLLLHLQLKSFLQCTSATVCAQALPGLWYCNLYTQYLYMCITIMNIIVSVPKAPAGSILYRTSCFSLTFLYCIFGHFYGACFVSCYFLNICIIYWILKNIILNNINESEINKLWTKLLLQLIKLKTLYSLNKPHTGPSTWRDKWVSYQGPRTRRALKKPLLCYNLGWDFLKDLGRLKILIKIIYTLF